MCCNPGSIDGTFGVGTEAAVKAFQSKYLLTADGVVGIGTWNKLKSLDCLMLDRKWFVFDLSNKKKIVICYIKIRKKST